MEPMISRLGVAVLCALAFSACTLKDDNPLAQPADAHITPSGLASKVLRVGLGGVHPTLTTRVTVHYTGWTPDGRVFDSSVDRGQPITFQLTQVIPGWTEGLQLMVAGEKRRFWIPATLAYGDTPAGQPAYDPANGQPPTGPLVFDIELLAIR